MGKLSAAAFALLLASPLVAFWPWQPSVFGRPKAALVLLLAVILSYHGLRSLLADSRCRSVVLLAVQAAGAVNALLMLLQYFSLDPFFCLHVEGVANTCSGQAGGASAMGGFIGNSHFAALVVAISSATAQIASRRGVILWVVSIPALILQGGVLPQAAAFAAIIWSLPWGGETLRRRAGMLLPLAGLAISVLLALWQPGWDAPREKSWALALEIGIEHPLGVGLGGYQAAAMGVLGVAPEAAHNDWLQLFAEQGWIFLALGVTLVLKLARRGLTPALVAALVASFGSYPLRHWALMGLAMIVVAGRGRHGGCRDQGARPQKEPA